ncbi:hypothetical protein KY284_033692 [Solanum tuberosum]|nr:hypothetical protein KY284_033692 [Solanum tuberosum]
MKSLHIVHPRCGLVVNEVIENLEVSRSGFSSLCRKWVSPDDFKFGSSSQYTHDPPGKYRRSAIGAAEERKAAVRKIPEQMILSEVRRMVEEMQALNKKLEDTETAITDYFKPLDQQAEEVVKMQLKGDEKRKDEMMDAMQRQALVEMAQAEKQKNMQMLNTNKHVQDKASTETLNQK